MKFPNLKFMSREKILASAAAVLVVIAAQMYMIREIRNAAADLQSAREGAMISKLAEASRKHAISQYNSSLLPESILMPSESETSGKFYSQLLSMLSNQGFKDAEVSKSGEDGRLVSFKIKGTTTFSGFMHLMASFRQGAYLMRVSELALEGMGNNMLRYTFTVSARIAHKGGGAAK
ncbi:MAG: hypothetical protein Q4E17_01090 [Synergistes sp.]|nr:hypothetical protein [Synergistes sp.]